MNTKHVKAMRGFLILLLTQGFSALGSSMTSFALIVWSYKQEGSALQTALLSVCSYASYVLVSLFAGALSDRWSKKRVMLVCDAFAACTTVAVAALLRAGRLEIWHLYVRLGEGFPPKKKTSGLPSQRRIWEAVATRRPADI